VPKADSFTITLFDHLVGAAECLGGLEVGHKPVSRGLLKWQIARFLAA
jgi:hypothetical protein